MIDSIDLCLLQKGTNWSNKSKERRKKTDEGRQEIGRNWRETRKVEKEGMIEEKGKREIESQTENKSCCDAWKSEEEKLREENGNSIRCAETDKSQEGQLRSVRERRGREGQLVVERAAKEDVENIRGNQCDDDDDHDEDLIQKDGDGLKRL